MRRFDPWLRVQRGSVMVLLAAAMFPLAGIMTFVIDVSHWFDYSRNLQNRADAAALAGGDQYGNTCFVGSAGDVWTGAQSAIGKWAQLYSGPGTTAQGATEQGSAAGSNTANVPYNASGGGGVFATTGVGSYQNQTNLKKGPLANYYVRLNATDYFDKGAPANFSMGDFCTSTPAPDVTDGGTSPGGPMVDVKVTQKQLGNFIPIFGSIGPNIEAHARVQLQGEASSSDVRPIAVRDSGFTPCVAVQFMNANTNTAINTSQGTTVTLGKEPVNGVTVTWDNSGAVAGTSPVNVPIPSGANVYIQPILSDCHGNSQIYNDSTNTGLLYINSHPASNPANSATSPPQLTQGGVTMVNGTCNPDQYFSATACQTTLSAWLEVAPGLNTGDLTLTVVDHESTGTVNYNLNPPNGFLKTGVPQQWTSDSIPIAAADGLKQFEIKWSQTNGSVGATLCGDGKGHNPNPCTGTFGIQQTSFGTCDGCVAPDDSGPIVMAQLSQSGVGTFVNTLAAGQTANNLVVTLKLTSLAASNPGDPATILRFGSGQQSGLIDCGQGNGASQDYQAILNGCGPNNSAFNPRLNPLYVNTRNGDCTNPPWPQGNHQDCVQTTPGVRRTQIPQALVDHINAATNCPTNYWQASYNYRVDPTADPRAITMIITSDVDLTLAHNGSQAWIPIWQFAVFYVTGWDTHINPNCNGPNGNESFPGGGKKNSQNGAIWGHWIKYTEIGVGNGAGCNLGELGNCVPVLIR